MFDIWGFLLQTLTASGVAVMLLFIKALFKDKLPPKWHFAVWGVLGIMLIIPAGWNGRYTLINWKNIVEVLKVLTGDFSYSKVAFPFPVVQAMPVTIAEWIFAGYVLGAVLHLVRYIISYIYLRIILLKGKPASKEIMDRIKEISEKIKVKSCRVIAVEGLPSAFVCGIIRPVMVIPAGEEIDTKILLHELIHLKSKDTLWSILICVLRSIHWCNPIMVYCANCATNDMENRCDQFVMEQLEGEERRDYGHILLSMANERFAKTPGTTCVNNGGKHIRERIENIARFKKYPSGMGLVSVCVLMLMTFSMVVGVHASDKFEENNSSPVVTVANARCISCSTPAEAFGTYGKSIVEDDGYYRIMCAPVDVQKNLCKKIIANGKSGIGSECENFETEYNYIKDWYYVYNLKPIDKNTYEGTMVFVLYSQAETYNYDMMNINIQNIRVLKEDDRWVAIPLDDLRSIKAPKENLDYGCVRLPRIIYSGEVGEFKAEVMIQTIYKFEKEYDNSFTFGYVENMYSPNVDDESEQGMHKEFASMHVMESSRITYSGKQAERDEIEELGLSTVSVYPGEERPEKTVEINERGGVGCSSRGEGWNSRETWKGWGPSIDLGIRGFGSNPELNKVMPEFYVADIYVNGEHIKQLDLYPQEGED